MMGRTLVIGDIHGGLRALEQLMERAAVGPDDRLIFLGDYVDGWSESAQTIQFLMQLSETYSCVFIKGNHDDRCAQWLSDTTAASAWAMNAGITTVKSYAAITAAEQYLHLAFFEKMKLYYTDEHNRLFIHAGYTSINGPGYEVSERVYNCDRTLWEMALVMDSRIERHSVLYPKRLKLFSEIYIGHTPTLNYNSEMPMHMINVWNIDTGAGFTGRLSMIDADTKQVWQSDPLPMLYPDERGRNAKAINEM